MGASRVPFSLSQLRGRLRLEGRHRRDECLFPKTESEVTGKTWIGQRGTVLVLLLAVFPCVSPTAYGSYVESYQTWSATSADTWESKDLSGAPFNVPANAVVEVAVRNSDGSNAMWGGARAVGSSLDRQLQLHKAESGGWDVLVIHVQANAGSRIEHYADVTSEIQFILLGYWTNGTYVETFQSFKAGADGSWQEHNLGTYGVGAGEIAEIVMVNGRHSLEREVGVRANGSALDRIVDIHKAESGGGDVATMFVEADATANATVEVYAEDNSDVDFYLVGYWSTPPGSYTELFTDTGSPSTDSTWQDRDLTSLGIPGNAVVEITLGNMWPGEEDNMGVRQNGSTLSRLLDLHEAEGGGGDFARMHVCTDAGSTIELYHEDVSDTHDFRLTGYWVVSAVTVTESGGSTDVTEGGPTDTYTVVLTTQPTATVTITVDPDDQTDLGSGAGVAITLPFTTGNWGTAQTVTVTAVDDAVQEGDHTSTITHTASSSDGNYDGTSIVDVTANVLDNDAPEVRVTESGDSTDVAERGATDTYTVVLTTLPTATVTVTVDPDDQIDLGSGTGVAIVLTFTTGNWSTERTVTVTAVDDGVPEDAHTSIITHSASSTDGDYDGISISDVTANITEFAGEWKLDEGAGATVSDCTAAGNDGSLKPDQATGPQWTALGKICSALGFDGSNDYVRIPADSSLDMSGDVDISGWFKLDSAFNSSTATSQILLEKFNNNNNNMHIALVGIDYGESSVADGSLVFKIEESNNSRYKWTNRTSWTAGQWYHFTVILRASDNASNQIFINGTDDTGGDAGSATTASMSFNADINIGGKNAASSDLSGSRYFDGLIDEIGVNKGGLSDTAIEDLAAQAYYTRTDLGTLTGEPSLALGINASGQVAGYDEDASTGNESAWFWEDGSFTSLGTLGGATSAARDLNASGTVVGRADTAGGDTHAFSWDSVGGMQDLGVLSGRTDSVAYGANGDDEVVGASLNLGASTVRRLAFLYLPSAAYGLPSGMNNLGTLGGNESMATDVNDSGQVVGGAQDSSADMRPFLWLPSAAYGLSAGMNDLGTLGGDSRRIAHRAQAINASGQVVGMSYTAAGDAHAFLWLPSAAYGLSAGMNDLGTLTGGDTSWAFGIANDGKVVGTSNVTDGDFHGFIWENGTMTDLNDQMELGSGWEMARATNINANGYPVGWGTNASSQTRAIVLTAASCGCGGARSPWSGLVWRSGSETTDSSGTLEILAIDDGGEPLAEILVNAANPGETFECEITVPAADAAGAPGPGRGTFAGFADGVALDHTLGVDTSATPGGFNLTVAMVSSVDELASLGLDPADVEIHVLDAGGDPPPGVWVAAGSNIGESASTRVVGNSGYFVKEDRTVSFWAVRDRAGVFAVGARSDEKAGEANPIVPPPRSSSASVLCGAGAAQVALLGWVTLLGRCVFRRSYGDRSRFM